MGGFVVSKNGAVFSPWGLFSLVINGKSCRLSPAPMALGPVIIQPPIPLKSLWSLRALRAKLTLITWIRYSGLNCGLWLCEHRHIRSILRQVCVPFGQYLALWILTFPSHCYCIKCRTRMGHANRLNISSGFIFFRDHSEQWILEFIEHGRQKQLKENSLKKQKQNL